ncbi:hypothetical protein [Mucilaginibacter sp. OK283]|uniref:hypothetical protein n=1 Tax=Mucilaginibacter sp. OK283 TaxID=1881049 RepID=UPI000B80380B|nr:hypothetical protein [Mucilaginibacter sp. OK283]
MDKILDDKYNKKYFFPLPLSPGLYSRMQITMLLQSTQPQPIPQSALGVVADTCPRLRPCVV